MRPDKPGYWWYKTSDGRERIADIASGFSFELCVINNHRPVCVSVFECSSEFDKWLGQVRPPKKVRRIKVDVVKELLSGYRNAVEVYYGTEEDDHGDLVKYDDVKEYLIGEDDGE
jgi:hypothetical protein